MGYYDFYNKGLFLNLFVLVPHYTKLIWYYSVVAHQILLNDVKSLVHQRQQNQI